MKINFCVECTAPLNKKSDATYNCPNGHAFWNNPKTTVAVVVLRDDKILVSKRGIEPRKGMYDLPGGFVDPRESIEQAAIREMTEETGLIISDLGILASYPDEYLENIYVCDVIVLARTWSGTPTAQDDVAALEWQPLEFLDSSQFYPSYTGLQELLEQRVS